MRKVLIITGHGSYASGMKSALELIAGQNNDVYFVDFEAADSDITLRSKFDSLLNNIKNSQILFICDLPGGTPFKVSGELAYNNDNLEVVAGCNLGSILESIFEKDSMSITELAKQIVKKSINSTIRFKSFETQNSQTVEEGI
jgi:N-acetylgalactosamine PTS system EIIA component